MVAVAGDRTTDLGAGRLVADWRYNKPAVDGTGSEINVKLKAPTRPPSRARQRIEEIVGGVVAAHRYDFPYHRG